MNFLFRNRWFPLAAQLVLLAVFVALIIGGLAAHKAGPALFKELKNTNLANLVVWSFWWPLIVLSAIFLGRAWCMVCPMELVTSMAAKVGMKKRPPAFLKSGWVITLFFAAILFVGIQMFEIHRVPFRMALYMLTLLAAALVTGFLYSRNTFCGHVCPVGHLLGLYARLAPMGWGVRDRKICQNCPDRSCIAVRNAYRFQGRSCGVGLVPDRINDNTDCLLCGQCVKACAWNNPGAKGRPNPGWFIRPWFKDILALKPLTMAQAVFVLVVSGFVIHEIFTEWKLTSGWVLWVPERIAALVGAGSTWNQGLIRSLTLFAILPVLIVLVPYGFFRLLGGTLKLGKFLLRFGLAFIPITAAAHAVKSLLKMSSRIPYWGHAFRDPVGTGTAKSILGKSVSLVPLPGWCGPVVTAGSLVLIIGGIVLSAVTVRRLTKTMTPDAGWRNFVFYLIPVLYGGAFVAMLVAWRLF